MSEMKDFIGKAILVTGSSSGIGAATAIGFAKLGADVVVTGRNKERLEKVAMEVAKVTTSPKKEKSVIQVIADVTKTDDCEKLIKAAIDAFGKLDILINNAGSGAITLINDPHIMEVYDKIMDVNLKSVIRLTHLAVPHLEKTKGQIINISSVAGLKPVPLSTVYCMAKSGIDMFTRCMALELGPKGIRVNTINPGLIRTNFNSAMGIPKELTDKLMNELAKMTPVGRVGEPIDIVNAIIFLTSNGSSFITGDNLVSDGGIMWIYPQPNLK